MKKAIGIIILGLLLSSNAYAKDKFVFDNCQSITMKGKFEKLTYIVDTNKRTLNIIWKIKDEYKNDHPQPIGNTLHENVKINKTTVEYGDGENRYKFNYGGDGLDFKYKPNYLELGRCGTTIVEKTEEKKTTETSNKTELIIQAKKTCLDLGFTAGTEKFGDCTLKVLKMKSQ